MVTVYAISLVLGVVGLVLVILGGTLAENLRRPEWDPGARLGILGRSAVAGLTGFGMGGLSAEFAPLDLGGPIVLLLALVAGIAAAIWARYVISRLESG